MNEQEYLDKLQSTINFYKKSLSDYEKALNYCPTHFKEYDIIINKMLECGDDIDRCNIIIKSKMITK